MDYKTLREMANSSLSESALLEMAKLDKYSLYREDARKVSSLLKEAKSESDTKKKKDKYQEALANAKKLRTAASKIADDDVGDWIFNLFCKPWWWFLADVVGAVSSGEGIGGQARSQAVSHYDKLIKKIESEISRI